MVQDVIEFLKALFSDRILLFRRVRIITSVDASGWIIAKGQFSYPIPSAPIFGRSHISD